MAVNKEILAKLIKLEADMSYIKESMEDSTLTGEDIEALEEYNKEKKAKMLISHTQLKKEVTVF